MSTDSLAVHFEQRLAEMDALLTAAYHDEAKAKAEIARLREALKIAAQFVYETGSTQTIAIIDAALKGEGGMAS